MIRVKGLTKIFPPDCKAVDNIDLNVEKGEIIGFLGPNGAGKSTTIRILTTLSPFAEGSVRVAGFDVQKDGAKVREVIGYVAQDTGIDYFLTGRENLILQGRMYRMKTADILKRVDELAKYFDLESNLDKLVSMYSGGMRRKLDIATALIHDPQILFLDEPTLGLDIKSRQSLWDYITKLNKELDLTIILTTHYLEEADKLAKRVIIINEGQIKISGTPDELKNSISGDSMTLSFETVDNNLKSFVKQLESKNLSTSITWDGDNLHLYVDNGAEAVPKIMSEFTNNDYEIKTISLSRPTLDDVFLKYTGTSMLEIKEDTGEEWWMQWAGKGGGSNKWWSPEEDGEEGEWTAEEAAEWQASKEGSEGKWSAEEIADWHGKEDGAHEGESTNDDSLELADQAEGKEDESTGDWQSGKWTPEEMAAWQAKGAEKPEDEITEADETTETTDVTDKKGDDMGKETEGDWQPGKWSAEEMAEWQSKGAAKSEDESTKKAYNEKTASEDSKE